MRSVRRVDRRCRWLVVAGVLAGIAAVARGADERKLPEDPAAEQKLLADAGAGFQIHRTDHFLIAYNTDDDTLHDFVARVEATYRGGLRFMDLHELKATPLKHRLEILFFDTPEGFREFAERMHVDVTGAAGFYHRASRRAFFYNARHAERVREVDRQIDRIEEQAKARRGTSAAANAFQAARRLRTERDRLVETINVTVVQHEVAHQVFFNLGLHNRSAPSWVIEGLAMLLETAPGSEGAGLGAVNQYRLLSFREALAGDGKWRDADARQFAAACAAGRLVPLRAFVGDEKAVHASEAHPEQLYAQAWSLVYYLQAHRREDLAVYLTVLYRRPVDRGYTPEQELLLFEKTFGPIDEQFEQRWLNFLLKQRVRPPT